MRNIGPSDYASPALARRALLTTTAVSFVGSIVALIAVFEKTVFGPEIPLIYACFVVTCVALLAQLAPRRIPLQTIATAVTTFYGLYLCAGAIIAIAGSNEHLHLFIYLVWFFPLLTLNQLVNSRAVGRFFSVGLLLAPLAIIVGLAPRVFTIFKVDWLIMLASYLVAYYAYGLALRVIMQSREQFIVERERAESHEAQTDLLETLSDCFIAVDSAFNVVYLNQAACTEFGVERHLALQRTLGNVAPGFISMPMLAELKVASARASTSVFESQNEALDRWYEMRCFPRPDGMSVYFRNITERVSSRRELEAALTGLREQAELLDKAQDGIFVHDMEHRIVYWNRGAERLYGWTAEEATGKLLEDVLPDTFEVRRKGIASALQYGGSYAEISQRRHDGSTMVVESRCTLVNGADGKPRAILEISTDITNRKAAEARIEHLAYYDPLTDLPNRSLLIERLDGAIATSAGDGNTGALLFIDLDDFKTTNATLGHEIGDLLLRRVAARLTGSVRKGDTVARLTGDEFVVMLQGLHRDPATAAQEATAVAKAVQEASLDPFHIGDYEYNGSVSIGITLFCAREDSADELLKRGELALFQAKAKGRNALCYFDASMQTFVDARASLESDLRKALQNGEFELHYQPVIGGKGQVRGAEGLLRWNHPVRGLVPPDEFIPLAEECGLIIDLGRWVLETACAQLAEFARYPDLRHIRLAVNVSLRQFLASNFVDLVLEALAASGADPRQLTLEITESFAMVDLDDTIAKMTRFKEHHIRFAMDDFGTGYSSLSRLKRLPIDVLKVDRSFVSDMLVDERSASLVRTIIALGRNLNLHVIGEGVETEEQHAFLKSAGCESFQGYLFSPALPKAKFKAYAIAAEAAVAAAAAAAPNGPLAA